MKKIYKYLTNPELIYLFFSIRLSKIVTSFFDITIDVSESKMKKDGCTRTIKNGKVYFTYKGKTYPSSVAFGNAVDHISDYALRFCKGKGLDIGSKTWPLKGAFPIDNNTNINAYKLDKFENNSLDFIFSSHCLEHLHDWRKALILWIRKLNLNGILFLYLPHHSMTLWEPGSPWVKDDHVWQPKKDIIVSFLKENNMLIEEAIEGPDDYFSFYIIAKKN